MDEIERRFVPFSEEEHRLLPMLLGGYLAKKALTLGGKTIAKKVGQKFGGQAVDLLSKHPTGGAIVAGLDKAGVLKDLGIKQSAGWQSSLIKKLDEPVFDLGDGKSITVGQVAGWNLGTALSPELESLDDKREAPKLSGTLIKYGDRANMGSFVEQIEPGAFSPVEELDAGINVQHQRDKPLARTQGGGLVLIDSPEELKAEFDLPDTQNGHDAAELINRGVLRGLSVEMSVPPDGQTWRMENGVSLRTIHKAKLHGLGIVDSPAYVGSLISQRALEYAHGVTQQSLTETERDFPWL